MPKLIIVSGPVIVENNKVLLNKDKKDNFWKFCGGQVKNEDSNLKATAQREAQEEMSIDIEILDDAPYLFYTEQEKDEIKISVVLVHFLARRIGEIIPGADIQDWRLIDINNLDSESLAPNIRPTLKHFGF